MDSIFDTVVGWWQSILQSVLALCFASSVTFDATGRTVYYTVGEANVGEGAYSVVLKASGAFESHPQYALKKMLIQSEEADRMVRNEIEAFKRFHHPHIIGLLDHTIVNEGGMRAAYLLFPLVANGSLSGHVAAGRERTVRRLTNVLQGFLAVCEAVNVLHTYAPSYVHQDIKLENVLTGSNHEPYLIDLGSVRLADVRIETRKDALRVAEEAAQHCTASYRSPELYDPPRGVTLDARTDVWSLGCLLFAWWFGYSPFECEFVGDVPRVVECSSLRVLAAVPRPSTTSRADAIVLQVVEWILVKDFTVRPYTSDVIDRVREVLAGLLDGDNAV